MYLSDAGLLPILHFDVCLLPMSCNDYLISYKLKAALTLISMEGDSRAHFCHLGALSSNMQAVQDLYSVRFDQWTRLWDGDSHH